MKNSNVNAPEVIENNEYRYDLFDNGKVFHGKKKNHLPAMGWNSWNAFGSANTAELTEAMAEKIVELGLDKLGYKYVVLDDGCYLPDRVDGRLSNDTVKFPEGFKKLADKIHSKGLKFGMYNDIGTNLCAGAYVGTCGFEREDAESYIEWGVDFIKVDNCYYLWDNATFSNAENAKYVYAPAIASITVAGHIFIAGKNISVIGNGIKTENTDGKTYFTGIGTFDGTGPQQTPVGDESGELFIDVEVADYGEYELKIDCIAGTEPGRGSWLTVATGKGEELRIFYDDMYEGKPIPIILNAGTNRIRIMNHRRQENTLCSYAKFLEGLMEADPENDIIYSLCEWGKTQPQNWAKKVGDSWRILNDISFAVGSPDNYGRGDWEADYTTSITSQYNKCVIMDEFASLSKGWNDPDMMVIGMNGLDMIQYRTHMTMWCMMNSPLMLGFDLRRVTKGDELYNIIANKDIVALNQDALGVQAKRVFSSLESENPDTEYITNNDRVDILAKPLCDGSIALSFINLSKEEKTGDFLVDITTITNKLSVKMKEEHKAALLSADWYTVKNLWTGEITENTTGKFAVDRLEGCDNVTIRIVPGK